MRKLTALALTAASVAIAAPTQAVLLQYTISGTDVNAQGQVEYASFQVDSNPVPDGSQEGIGFFVAAVPGTYTYGNATTTDPQDISFYLDEYSGGLQVGDGDLLSFEGPQLFEGTIQNPTLLTGDFTLTDYYSGSPISLVVTEAAVPEPANWALMVGGFALAGGAMRRTRRVAARVSRAA